MEGLNTEEEKNKETEMPFSSGWLKETTWQQNKKGDGMYSTPTCPLKFQNRN